MSNQLTLRSVTKTYANGPLKVEVLKGIDLTVEVGQLALIMGPSGVGKSTLLHLIGGLDNPTSGTIEVNGTNIFNISENEKARFRNANIGFVFQFHHLLPEFTALENILIPGMIHHAINPALEQEAKNLMAEVGLSDRMHHRPGELSGGEQQRVAVARALINRPQLILADEPTGNLDKRNSEALYQLILKLNEKYNQTFIIVTHNEMMAKKASRVIELEDGKVKI
jgi:lipoprotein-releasing system ATP-binding protein